METFLFLVTYITNLAGFYIIKSNRRIGKEKKSVYDVLNAYLENGLKIILHKIPEVKTVSCGLWVKQGSSYESDEFNGLSHLAEHLLMNAEDVINEQYKYLIAEITDNGVMYNAALEKAMKENNTDVISPSMCYAYAAIAEDAPFVMGAPNLCVDTPAMWEFSKQKNVPISGKDFKSGQTLMKTVLAPMFKTRMLGVNGWFSTNILGNRDGEVLDDPDNFKTKEVSKLSVIDTIFEPEKYPDLYGDVYHKVRINYYPPRKDNKEAWDNIDIFGWMGYPMEIKVNFLCRDSILAAPIALDLVLFSDLAMRAGMCGIQTWLSFFCKSPMHDFEHQPEHDLFTQWRMVKQTLRNMIGEKEPDYLA